MTGAWIYAPQERYLRHPYKALASRPYTHQSRGNCKSQSQNCKERMECYVDWNPRRCVRRLVLDHRSRHLRRRHPHRLICRKTPYQIVPHWATILMLPNLKVTCVNRSPIIPPKLSLTTSTSLHPQIAHLDHRQELHHDRSVWKS